jgi:YcxB-like protein
LDLAFCGQLSESDLLAAQWLHIRPRRSYQLVGMLLLALFLIAVVLGVYGAIRGTVSWFNLSLAVTSGAVLALWAAWFRWRVRKVYRQQVSLHGDQRYRATDEYLDASSPHGSGILNWSAIVKWRQSDKLVLLYQSDLVFHVIPKRWMTPDQIGVFAAFLSSNVGDPLP